MTAASRDPPRRSALWAVLAATVALAVLAGTDAVGALVAVPGVALVGAGAVRGNRGVLTGGAGLVVLGVLYAGAAGGGALPSLVAAAAAVVAWDVGEHGVGLGEQVGAAAHTDHAVDAHAVASVAVGGLAAGTGYLVFRVAAGGRPLAALVLLLVAALVLTVALRA